MKKLLIKLTPKTILNKVNLALTGVFCVMLAGMLYMKSVNAAMESYVPCPEFDEDVLPHCPWPCPGYTVFFPHPNDPQWFFGCSNGVAFCLQCPAGLAWNPQLETCDWPPQPNFTCHNATRPSVGRSTFRCRPCDWVPDTMPAPTALVSICW